MFDNLENFNLSDIDNGVVKLEAGIHSNITIAKCEFITTDQGKDQICTTFIKNYGQKDARGGSTEEVYVLRTTLPEPTESKLKFFAQTITHIYSQLASEQEVIDTIRNLGKTSDIEAFAQALNGFCQKGIASKTMINLKLIQDVYNGKASVKINLVDRPFVDMNGGKKLKWNPSVDIKVPQESGSEFFPFGN